MVDHKERVAEKLKESREVYDQWKDVSQAHWNHWRAWGSWFSWGSPVGLGLFFVLLSVAGAIIVWTIKL